MTSISTVKSNNPLVSVIIPVFNRNKEILATIQSLNAQTYSNFEVIFIDDYSFEPLEVNLYEQARSILFNYRVTRNSKNKGVSYSRNLGVKLAKGEFISFLDSDDLWHPEKLESNVQQTFGCANKVFAMSKTNVIRRGYDEVLPKVDFSRYDCAEEYLFEHGHFVQVSSFFLSRDLANQIEFNESLSQYEDFLYFIEGVNKAESKVFIDTVLVTWNDLPSQDRLSNKKSYQQAFDFQAIMQNQITETYRNCFFIRFVMPYYFYSNILISLSALYNCIISTKIAKPTLVWLLVRGILGPTIVESLRGYLKK